MKRGFTLIELLVVIAIIGLLSGVAVALISNTQITARDSERVAQVNQIKRALALYATSQNRFPIHTETITITGEDAFSLALENENVIPEVPADPNHPTHTYTYQSDTTGGDYTITFCLETDSIPGFSEGCSNTIKP